MLVFLGTAPLLFILYHCKLPLFDRELNALHCGYKIIHTYKIKIDHITSGTEIYEIQNKIHTDSHVLQCNFFFYSIFPVASCVYMKEYSISYKMIPNMLLNLKIMLHCV